MAVQKATEGREGAPRTALSRLTVCRCRALPLPSDFPSPCCHLSEPRSTATSPLRFFKSGLQIVAVVTLGRVDPTVLRWQQCSQLGHDLIRIAVQRSRRWKSLRKAKRSSGAHVNRNTSQTLSALTPFLVPPCDHRYHRHVKLCRQPRHAGFSLEQSSGSAARAFGCYRQHAACIEHCESALSQCSMQAACWR